MALSNSDLFYVYRGGQGWNMPASQLIDFIAESSGSLNYKGTIDCTVNAAPTAVAGDIYLNTGDGTVVASWVGIVSETIANGQRVVYDGSNWAIVGAEAGGGVETVGSNAPITVTGAASDPIIGITEATDANFGSARLATAPPTSGDLTSTATTDVLSVPHFNELAGRITTSAAGGIQDVDGVDPIEVSVDAITHAATVSIKDATIIQKGSVTLSNSVSDVETTAITPKGVKTYSVPLDLTTLTELN